ncbi:hypothetical protein F2Q68_00003689 [Brassica cretica]|uniref:Uncharacterized protein n=1 Tax=Brassica cretica TaxID=69181 RepID=A0A8S9JIT3_BRACR|nr:hypothetical protein F2Q68_00003689 [Brassica cretica]
MADLPVEALNEAISEVREVMSQYTNCPDPTKSASRKERYRQAKESEPTLQSPNPMSPQAPALMRLGPVMEDEEETLILTSEPHVAITKHKPGRPPGRRNILSSPLSFLGVG